MRHKTFGGNLDIACLAFVTESLMPFIRNCDRAIGNPSQMFADICTDAASTDSKERSKPEVRTALILCIASFMVRTRCKCSNLAHKLGPTNL